MKPDRLYALFHVNRKTGETVRFEECRPPRPQLSAMNDAHGIREASALVPSSTAGAADWTVEARPLETVQGVPSPC